MNKFFLNRTRFSRLVWETLLDKVALQEQGDLFDAADSANNLRQYAKYNTGSISDASVFCVFAVARYFQPQFVAEVGTFIGRSTLALAYGMRTGYIDTCDYSNNIELPASNLHHVTIRQYMATSAEGMFRRLNAQGYIADMIYIDGRLSGKDFPALTTVLREHTIVMLDDFEGTEKGVANTFTLMNVLTDYRLVYPPENSLLREYGVFDGCTTALLLPSSLIEWSNQ